MAKQTGNRLRIIGGQWRSRQLPFPDVEGLRPTTDRVRETVFNWLTPYLHGAVVLDMFAGSGALGFEALSRGAATVTLLEKNSKAAKQLQDNARTLNTQDAKVIQTDALSWLTQPPHKFDLVFLDPPFNKGLLQQCIELLDKQACLNTGSWVYIESEADLASLGIPRHWHLHRDKKAGQVMLRLFQVGEA